jgi:hypothetical protein
MLVEGGRIFGLVYWNNITFLIFHFILMLKEQVRLIRVIPYYKAFLLLRQAIILHACQ